MSDKQNDTLTFLVTVTYRCPLIIDRESLEKEYDNDPMAVWNDIADGPQDAPGYGDVIPESLKVEIEK